VKFAVVVVLALAAIWSIGIVAAAFVAPAYEKQSSTLVGSPSSGITTPEPRPVVTTSTSTLVEVNGLRVLVPVALPLFAVAVVAMLLARRRARVRRGAGPLAWTTVGLFAAFNLLAMLSIGIFILPVTGLLICACVLTEVDPPPIRSQAPS
jgi:hypothetical protein